MSLLALSALDSPSSQATEYTDHQPDSLLMGRMPDELILKIFQFLTLEELAKTSRVCRKWNRLASDNSLWTTFALKKLFPSLKVLDEETWKTYADLTALGLSVEDAQPLDKRKMVEMILELKRLFATLNIEGDAGITLLTIPRGLSIEKLETFAQSPKQGNPTCFRFIENTKIKERFWKVPVEKTYRVAITNSVLEGSRFLSVSTQQNLAKKVGCEMLELLPAITLIFLTYIGSPGPSPVRLYPFTIYTRCIEQIDGRNLLIGDHYGRPPLGLAVNLNYFSKDGIGVQRKF